MLKLPSAELRWLIANDAFQIGQPDMFYFGGFECKTSSLASDNGVVTVPSGPGLGIEIDQGYIGKHVVVKS